MKILIRDHTWGEKFVLRVLAFVSGRLKLRLELFPLKQRRLTLANGNVAELSFTAQQTSAESKSIQIKFPVSCEAAADPLPNMIKLQQGGGGVEYDFSWNTLSSCRSRTCLFMIWLPKNNYVNNEPKFHKHK